MRGSDDRSGSLFSYVDLEKRIRPDHPLRTIRRLVDDALASLDRTFADLYAAFGRPSIPPERLLRAMLLQAFYSIRSERLLMERLDYDLLFRWFVGLGIDDPVWDPSPLYGVHCVERYLLRADAVCRTKSGSASRLSGRRLAAPPRIRSALTGDLTTIPRAWAMRGRESGTHLFIGTLFIGTLFIGTLALGDTGPRSSR